MELSDLRNELFRRGVRDGSYLEITLNNGELSSGRYSPSEKGEVILYTTRRGHRHYDASQIKSLVKIHLRRDKLPDEIRETIQECGD